MRILEMPPYYLPEQISSTHLTSDLTEEMVAEGFVIENHVPTPCRGISDELRQEYKKIYYEELYGGKVRIHRFPMWKEGKNPILRAIRYSFVHFIQGITCSNLSDVDVVIGGSTPPTQGLLCGKVAKKLSRKYGKKVPFVYLLQDVFPDSLVTTGLAKKGGILWKIGKIIENKVYQKADKIIVISEGIKKNIIEKGVPEGKIEVISNWIDVDEVHPVDKLSNSIFEEYKIDRRKFIVCYAGNLGAAQGTQIIVEAARRLSDYEEIQFVVFGRGKDYSQLADTIEDERLSNIQLFPVLPQDRVSEVYSLGDISLIIGKKGVSKTAMPSKLWTIMACNSRIVASFDSDSDLSKIISDCDAGVCVEAENSELLANAIVNEYNMKEKKKATNQGREYVCKMASKQVCVKRYIEVIKSLC